MVVVVGRIGSVSRLVSERRTIGGCRVVEDNAAAVGFQLAPEEAVDMSVAAEVNSVNQAMGSGYGVVGDCRPGRLRQI